MNTTSVKISGKIGYNDLRKPDKFSAGTPKPKYSLMLAVSDSELEKLKATGLDVARDKAGNAKSLESIGVEGHVIKGERLESKGVAEIVDLEGNSINDLLGYGSDIIVEGFVSTFTNNYGTFTKLYFDKITVVNKLELPKLEESQSASAGGVI